ncbi:uncharacterized protein LOC107980810 isoform X4 [Nasonia vitripennis]|uniref:Uncharacterized protein n=1 Tax=Nasonia vitripennis TaxID=7425 RepID=A0A7M7Q8B4_NASVI|nr:uncharacterized protein LOC107980810 isoform X4 [Nasonia vitripennis]
MNSTGSDSFQRTSTNRLTAAYNLSTSCLLILHLRSSGNKQRITARLEVADRIESVLLRCYRLPIEVSEESRLSSIRARMDQ